MKWLAREEEMEATPKDVFRLRLFFSNNLEPQVRKNMIQSQMLQHELRLHHLMNNKRKFKEVPDPSTDAFSDYLVLLGAIMREEMNCGWLKKCLELCEKSEKIK